MKTAVDHMAFYYAYHRDWRNRATHFIGVPLIVFSVLAALSRVPISETTTLAWPIYILVALYYIKLDWLIGLVMAFVLTVMHYSAIKIGLLPFNQWLTVVLACFIGGWILQLIGHVFEGRKPAFADNLFQLIVSPFFLGAEVLFALGYNPQMKREMQHGSQQYMAVSDKAAHS